MVIVSVIAHSVVVSMSAALRPSTEIAGPLELELTALPEMDSLLDFPFLKGDCNGAARPVVNEEVC